MSNGVKNIENTSRRFWGWLFLLILVLFRFSCADTVKNSDVQIATVCLVITAASPKRKASHE